VEILVMPDAGLRAASLLAGELDLVHELSPGNVSQVAQATCCRVLSRESQQVEYLAMRTTRPPYDDLRVRTAIDLALDRQALVDSALEGFGTPLSQLGNIHVFGHDPEILPTRRDLVQAIRLLEDAGYPDGLDLEVELRDTRDFSPVGAQLSEAGIRVTPRAFPWAEMYERLLGDEVNFYLGGIVTVSADLSDVLDSLVHTRDPELGYGQHNGVGYSDSTLDRLVELSSTTFGRLARRDALHRAVRRIHEDKAFLPLYGSYDLFGASRYLDWEPKASGLIQFSTMTRATTSPP
jgi:peptide/nickel transport system substrate-binding protein